MSSYEVVHSSPVAESAGEIPAAPDSPLDSPVTQESSVSSQSLQCPPSPLLSQCQGDASLQCHTFKSKIFRKKRACSVCHQIINTHGSSCRVCKYACHKSCEPKASSNCKESGDRSRGWFGRRSRDTTPERYQGNQALQIYNSIRRQDRQGGPPLQNDPLAKPRQPPTRPLPQGRLVAGRRCRERPDLPASMELNFVTQRVMALCFPPGVDAATYRDNLREVAQMLHTKHGDSYMIFNLSERRPELSELNRRVSEYGWPETLAPPLDKLCSICKAIDCWTAADPNNVAVLHSGGSGSDRGGWDRIGVVVSAYIHYSNICRSPDQALDRFAMKKFFDDKIRHLDHPSQKRYVNYFAGLLSGQIQINSSPLGLHHLVLVGAPQLRPSGGCRVFVRVYQGMVPVWTSAVYTVDDRAKYTVISPEMVLQLRGDILIKCYHCVSPSERQVVFRVQFHTCAVSDAVLSFPRQDLDDACDDMRFPLDGGVELHFSATSLGQDQVAAPVRPDHTPDPVQRWDSYDDFRTAAASLPDATEPPPHTEGPLDGSLYATVIKKPASPRSAAAADSHELHTVSMDSGISSGGRERLSGGSSHSPSGPHSAGSARSAPCDSSPLAAADTSSATPAPRALRATVEAPPSRVKKQPSVDASQLDELLSGLLENCSNIPDLRPCQTPAPDLDTIQTPTFSAGPASVSASRATSRGRTVSSRDADASVSSGYGSQQQSPPNPPPPAADMVHYNGYKSDSAFSESFSAKAEEEIPYHARSDSKPFSYANFSAAAQRRSPSPASDPPRRSESASREAPRAALESPRLVRKLLVGGSSGGSGGSGGSSGPSQPAGRKAPPSPNLPRKTFTNGSSSRSTVTETFSKTTNGSGSGGVGSRAPLKASDTLQSHRSFTSESAPSHRSFNTDTMKSYNTDTIKSYNTDTLRSNVSFNTDTLKSNRSYDWEASVRAKPSPAPAPAPAPPPAPASAPAPAASPSPAPSRALEPFRRAPPPVPRDIDINLNDPNAKTVTTYDQNTNSMTTVSTQSFDVPCSPNPTRKIVETTKRYMVDDDDPGRQTGVTKMEETIREFVIEDLPDGPGSAGNVTWLQKQQQKLRDRQQARIRNEREPKEARVLHELRQRQGGVEDGYMSDTTLWTDTSRETSPAQMAPLHVNTSGGKAGSSAPVSPQMAARSASRDRGAGGSYRYNQYGSVQRPLARHRSETAYDRERPHVQVLRGDQRKTSDSDLTHLTKMTQYSQFASTPVRDREGLLTIVNGQSGVRDPSEPRPETPAFPNPPKTPYQNQSQTLPPKSPTSQRERSPSPGVHQVHFDTSAMLESSPASHSRHSSASSDTEVISAHPTFVKDSSRWWYKPTISREQAISLLRDKAPGSFLIRDSNSFPGAFGLALKVESPPASAPARGGDPASELVRHFLIETTSKGVRLKGCPNEPTFGSLSALVYQHSITPLALPCKVSLPDAELLDDVVDSAPAAQQKHRTLLDTGAACSVLYLWSCDTEALTGPQAVRRATTELLKKQPLPEGVVVHFKVSHQGITLTDSLRKQFFRRHYNTNLVSHCSLDPEDRRWIQRGDDGQPIGSLRVFGFVAKKGPSNGNNQCHLFAEYDSDQPASAIVNFVTNVMMSSTYSARNNML